MALDLCFFNKECIRKREERQAAEQAIIQQQQQLLYNVSNTNAGGLKGWHIALIIGGAIGISAFIIYKIKQRKK